MPQDWFEQNAPQTDDWFAANAPKQAAPDPTALANQALAANPKSAGLHVGRPSVPKPPAVPYSDPVNSALIGLQAKAASVVPTSADELKGAVSGLADIATGGGVTSFRRAVQYAKNPTSAGQMVADTRDDVARLAGIDPDAIRTAAENRDWGHLASETIPPVLGGIGAARAGKLAEVADGAKSALSGAVGKVAEGPQTAVMADAAKLPAKAVKGAEDVIRVAAPVGSDPMFRKSVYAAAGDLAEVARNVDMAEAKGGIRNPDMRVRATVSAINDHLKTMYNEERAPQIQRNAEAPVVVQFGPDATEALQNIAKNGSDSGTRALAAHALSEQALPLSQVDELARVVNRETAPLRGLTPQELAQVEGGSRKIASAKALDAELGDKIHTELTNRGEGGIKQYERRYAALSDVRDQLQKRMNMAELQRRNPLTKAANAIGMVKNPLAGASQAATASVDIGKTLQRGLKRLSGSGLTAERATGTGRLHAFDAPLVGPKPTSVQTAPPTSLEKLLGGWEQQRRSLGVKQQVGSQTSTVPGRVLHGKR